MKTKKISKKMHRRIKIHKAERKFCDSIYKLTPPIVNKSIDKVNEELDLTKLAYASSISNLAIACVKAIAMTSICPRADYKPQDYNYENLYKWFLKNISEKVVLESWKPDHNDQINLGLQDLSSTALYITNKLFVSTCKMIGLHMRGGHISELAIVYLDMLDKDVFIYDTCHGIESSASVFEDIDIKEEDLTD